MGDNAAGSNLIYAYLARLSLCGLVMAFNQALNSGLTGQPREKEEFEPNRFTWKGSVT
jgi:hypothetical protein